MQTLDEKSPGVIEYFIVMGIAADDNKYEYSIKKLKNNEYEPTIIDSYPALPDKRSMPEF